MRKWLYFFLVVLVCSSAYEAHGQMNRRSIKKNNKRIGSYRGRKSHFGKDKVYNALGFSLSALNYYGDLAPRPNRASTNISYTRPAIGLSFHHRFGPRYTLVTNFMYGTLSGSDAESANQSDQVNGVFRYQRNLSFRNRIKELSVVAQFDLFENMATYISRVKWTPFAFLGVAGYHHNPQAKAPATGLNGQPLAEAGKWVNLRDLGTEGQYSTLLETDVNFGNEPYKLLQVSIPFGLGARFRVNEVVDISAELGFRYLFTDYIDDVSKNYVDAGVFGNNELAKAMSYRSSEVANPSSLTSVTLRDGNTYQMLPGYGQEHPDNVRGNKNDRDVFMTTTVRLTYILGKTFHRAKFR